MVAKVVFPPGPGLSVLFGFHEENLRHLESAHGVSVIARGNEVTVKGAKAAVEATARVLHRMRSAGAGISADEARGITGGRPTAPRRTPDEAADAPIRTPRLTIHPRGDRQKAYIAATRKSDVVFGIGPAGTGKTYLAVGCALEAFAAQRVERIILVRPVVEAGERLGFLPGDIQEKVNPYMRPLYDALQDMLDRPTLQRLMLQEGIEIAPLAFLRGWTLNKAFVILDEAQNTTEEQMKMFLTRLGADSKIVVTGDVTQNDLPKSVSSGLVHALRLLENVEGIGFIHFLPEDVVRHEMVQRILARYEQEDKRVRPASGRDVAAQRGSSRAGGEGG